MFQSSEGYQRKMDFTTKLTGTMTMSTPWKTYILEERGRFRKDFWLKQVRKYL